MGLINRGRGPKLDGIWSSKGLTPDSIQFSLVVTATFMWNESRVNPSFPLPVFWKSCDLDFVCFCLSASMLQGLISG